MTMTDLTWCDDEGFERVFPTCREVCPTCDGRGYQYLHGYDVTDMVNQDPDFAEDYMAGAYNTVCDECHGRNVIEVIDYNACSDEEKVAADEYYAYQNEMAHERRMQY